MLQKKMLKNPIFETFRKNMLVEPFSKKVVGSNFFRNVVQLISKNVDPTFHK
jgi:hypothetical protein